MSIPPLHLLCHTAAMEWADIPFIDYPHLPFLPSGARVKACRDEEKLRFLLLAPQDWEAVSVFLDPVGDREAYSEIGVTSQGAAFFRGARRGRSGTKIDASWSCDRFECSVRAGADGRIFEMSIPFASLGSIPPGPGWQVAIQQSSQAAFRPPRRFIPLEFGT